ncbi:MAG: hypothetical protein AAGA63_09960 [Pseudomonadota bacterium]
MSAAPKSAHEIETAYINELARHAPMSITVMSRMVGPLGGDNPSLVDVLHVLKFGEVVMSDMRGSLGLWTVFGTTTDDIDLELYLVVNSKECNATLVKIEERTRSE